MSSDPFKGWKGNLQPGSKRVTYWIIWRMIFLLFFEGKNMEEEKDLQQNNKVNPVNIVGSMVKLFHL